MYEIFKNNFLIKKTSSLTRQKFNRDKAAAMKRIKHDIRKLKRDRALLRAEVATNKDTIARLKSMD